MGRLRAASGNGTIEAKCSHETQACQDLPAQGGREATGQDAQERSPSRASASCAWRFGLQRIGVDFAPIPVSVIGFQVNVTNSIKGKIAAKQTIMVTMTRAHDIGTLTPPQQGEELVLFLKSSGDSWVSADKWFGCSHIPVRWWSI